MLLNQIIAYATIAAVGIALLILLGLAVRGFVGDTKLQKAKLPDIMPKKEKKEKVVEPLAFNVGKKTEEVTFFSSKKINVVGEEEIEEIEDDGLELPALDEIEDISDSMPMLDGLSMPMLDENYTEEYEDYQDNYDDLDEGMPTLDEEYLMANAEEDYENSEMPSLDLFAIKVTHEESVIEEVESPRPSRASLRRPEISRETRLKRPSLSAPSSMKDPFEKQTVSDSDRMTRRSLRRNENN